MQKKVFVDTSVLILFSKLNCLELLRQIYGIVYTTTDVVNEFGSQVPKWVLVIDMSINKNSYSGLGKGELSLLLLALNNENTYLIIDDLKARKIAKDLNIKFSGCIGVLIAAKKLGYINSIKPYLEKITHTNFRLSKDLQIQALYIVGEL